MYGGVLGSIGEQRRLSCWYLLLGLRVSQNQAIYDQREEGMLKTKASHMAKNQDTEDSKKKKISNSRTQSMI
jgi:hypothetical protein